MAFVVSLYSFNKWIGDDCNPEMDLDCILGIPSQGLHYNVLLYPFEEHLYVPSVPIQDGHFYCANLKVVSDEHYFFTRLLIIVADCPERLIKHQ